MSEFEPLLERQDLPAVQTGRLKIILPPRLPKTDRSMIILAGDAVWARYSTTQCKHPFLMLTGNSREVALSG